MKQKNRRTKQNELLVKLREGIAYHQQGRLTEAEKIYSDLIQSSDTSYLPSYLMALLCRDMGELKKAQIHFKSALRLEQKDERLFNDYGLLLKQTGQYERALEAFDRAIALTNFIPAFGNKGQTLQMLGEHRKAIECFEKAITKDSTNVELNNNLGISYYKLHDFSRAVMSYEKAIKQNPVHAFSHNNLALALQGLGKLDDALRHFCRAIDIDQKYAEAYYNRANLLRIKGEKHKAIEDYRNAITLKPGYSDAYNNLGNTLKEMGRFDMALEAYRSGLNINTNYAELHNNLANLLKDLGKHEEALDHYNRALSIKPAYYEAYNNRGNLYRDMGVSLQALNDYDKAIDLCPSFADAYANRGVVLEDLHFSQDALVNLNKAIKLKEVSTRDFYNLANSLANLGEFKNAFVSYEKAINIDPSNYEAKWNKSLLHLLLGEYELGWKFFESRKTKKDTAQNYPEIAIKEWAGEENLSGKTLLVLPEQGLGDVIQFIRLLAPLAYSGVNVIFESPSALANLAATFKPKIRIIKKGDQRPEADFYCYLLSLPSILRITLSTIPRDVPYFSPKASTLSKWNAKLGPKVKPRIGLAVSGSTVHKNDKLRSIKLEAFSELLMIPVNWHSLQIEYRSDDWEFLKTHQSIITHQHSIEDLEDTAALIECMDLVITVDTSIAHLSGSLGKNTWILLPYKPDYRWLTNRTDSPWYPTATLFRQNADKSWVSVLDNVRNKILEVFF